MDKRSVFLSIPKQEYILESEYFFVIRDRFPVSPGHSLIISKQLRSDFFDLNHAEKEQLIHLIGAVKENIEKEYSPDGYNIGMNCGEVAGQTVFHFHCHIIPRFKGDMENPRGGVRHVIEGKGYY